MTPSSNMYHLHYVNSNRKYLKEATLIMKIITVGIFYFGGQLQRWPLNRVLWTKL